MQQLLKNIDPNLRARKEEMPLDKSYFIVLYTKELIFVNSLQSETIWLMKGLGQSAESRSPNYHSTI